MNNLTTFSSLIGLSLALLLAGCGQSESDSAAAAAPAMPATPVDIMTVTPRSVSLSRELSGRTSASRIAEVRARINGIVLRRHFTEGADVSAGQLLFEIDPAPYQAALDSARANLARARANLESTRLQADRFDLLIASHAVSQQAYDDAQAAHQAATAEVAAAEAAVQSAEINLGYTRVTSPIDGRIGRAEVTEGAYVQQATATLLAVVQQLDPLYVDLTQSAEEVLKLRADLAAGRLQRDQDGMVKFKISSSLVDDTPAVGTLQFSDVTVNPGTGMVTLRGLLPNPDARFLPGMFVRAALEEGTQPNAILVPQKLVSRNARGEAVVWTVSPEQTATQTIITAARTVGDQWLVTAGLTAGDRLITNNLQKLRPGAPIQPTAATAVTSR